MKVDSMKIQKNSLMKIVLVAISLIALIGLFTLFKPQEPIKLPEDSYSSPKGFSMVDRIEDVPGVKDVKRFSDVSKNRTIASGGSGGSRNASSRPVPTPTPMPYPRIAINYTTKMTTLIRNESAGTNNTFMIVTLDVRNYGYRYFDAHPTKFKIVAKDGAKNVEFRPVVNVSTSNMLDDVVPNNSRAKGDLVFRVGIKSRIYSPKIVYLNDSYLILYRQVSQSVMDDIKEEKKSKYEEYEDY